MDSQWLKLQFSTNPDKTKADLARALGLEPPAISKILSGRRLIKAQEYIRMRDFFGLGGGSHAHDHRHFSPLARRNILDSDVSFEVAMNEPQAMDTQWVIPDFPARKSEGRHAQVRIFQISDSAMEPRFYKGESVVVDLSDTNISKAGAFIITDGHCFFARFCASGVQPEQDAFGYSGGYSSGHSGIAISAESPDFQPQNVAGDDIRVMGRIIGKMVWL